MASQREVFGEAARRYAAKGYVVLFIHYFDRTGTQDADIKETLVRFKALVKQKGGGLADEHIARQFQAWTATVRDAVAHARSLDKVDSKCIGLVGFSLGAYLALAVAAQQDVRIAAVIDFFGGLPRPLRPGVKTFPPVLILHGDKDQVVPVDEARVLADLLAALRVPHEVQIYPGVGHVFGDNRGGIAWAAALDAERRTSAFLAKHLQRPHARVAGPR
jgi:dienelactone hydrolase